MKAAGGGGESSSTHAAAKPQQQQLALYSKYPISSHWEFTLTNGETVKGEVYCTDPFADLVVLQDQLNDIRMVAVSGISESRLVKEASPEALQLAASSSSNNIVHAKKALEEREKRAIRLAQEGLKHLNPKVSCTAAKGKTKQAAFNPNQLVTHLLKLKCALILFGHQMAVGTMSDSMVL